MERDLDYDESDGWKYQFSRYPRESDPDAYHHDEWQKDAVLDLIEESREAARGGAPFSEAATSTLDRLLTFAVFGEYKTDETGEVKGAFDEMRQEWRGLFDRTIKNHPTAEAVLAQESIDGFFWWWYCILDGFCYTQFVDVQRYEYDRIGECYVDYRKHANALRIEMKVAEARQASRAGKSHLATCLDAIQKTADETQKTLQKGVQIDTASFGKAYAKYATMTDEELRDVAEPRRRNSGAGRKKSHDIGDKQVKAVLALSPEGHKRPKMECCDQIIRQGGDYKNPYADAKALASAVTRYCNRKGITATFKPPQGGAWTADL